MSDWNPMILPQLIAQWTEKAPDRDVLTFVDIDKEGRFRDVTRTYRQLWDNGQRVAQALQEAGMGQGDRFAIIMQNHAEFVDAMVGSGIANTNFVPIDPRTQGSKLKFMLDFAECRGALVADYILPQLQAVLPELEQLEWVWVVPTSDDFSMPADLPGGRDLREVLAAPVPDLPILAQDETDPMQMLYTSGTTGDPKAIVAPYARFGAIASLDGAIGLREDDRPYSGLSLTHANAQLITLGNVLMMGLRGVFSRKFTKSRLWDICRHYGCTQFNLLGGMTTAIYSEPEKPDDADNPVRYVLSAGMPPAIWEKFSKRFGVDIFEFYGTAEGGVSMNPPGEGPIGSMGKPPAALEAKILDEEDNECPPGVQGELVFRNADGSGCPQVQYYKKPEASAKKTRGGWFRTGDICHMDEDGWLYFDYRDGDAIRHNGDFVNPTFVEKEVAEYPDVDDVFVYGVDAASGVPGERDVVAAVVPRDRGRFDPQALYAHCYERLERNFVPSYIQVMDEIPKTASEKPMKRFCAEALKNDPDSVFTDESRTSKRA
ncbi:AMP-binding protein [Salinisphaera sp. PC39]|uniref:class I adenylate-forming enzyme family protein n=1 Tax=Salinisphaera sp. PC39 TaxID=1304156 RepID=UPI00334012CC